MPALNSNASLLLAAKVSAAAVMLPTPLLPAAIVPPPLMVTLPNEAFPVSVALLNTFTTPTLASAPLTASVPLLTVVGPV